MKAGYKTTEFWLTLGTTIGSVASSLQPLAELNPLFGKVAAIGTVAPTVIYTLSRSLAKSFYDVQNIKQQFTNQINLQNKPFDQPIGTLISQPQVQSSIPAQLSPNYLYGQAGINIQSQQPKV